MIILLYIAQKINTMKFSVSVWKDTGTKDEQGNPNFSRVYYQEHASREAMEIDFDAKAVVFTAREGYYVTGAWGPYEG